MHVQQSALPGPRGPDAVDRVAWLAREKFAACAADHDRNKSFPKEAFVDLHREGLISAAVPRSYGGLGLGPFKSDVHSLWLMTKEIAKADLSVARCWEAHNNAMVLIDGCGNDDQRQRWFSGVVDRGDIWVAWSGEPQAVIPGQKKPFGTYVTETQDGYIVDGSKVFASSAPGANWAILLVNSAGPGGARHSGADQKVLMLACDLSDSSVTFDDSWWDPIGMRGTVSYKAILNETFIPKADAIGRPGQYLEDRWQACFTPQYAASFLGGAEAAFDYTMEYLTSQNRAQDPYARLHMGQMMVNVESAQLWLRHVAQLWESKCQEEARETGIRARYVVEKLTEDTLNHAIRACGARCLNGANVLERTFRDLTFYFRHDNADNLLASIGCFALDEQYDGSFFRR